MDFGVYHNKFKIQKQAFKKITICPFLSYTFLRLIYVNGN